MAEGIARAHFDGSDDDFFIASAGIAAMDGAPTSPEAVAALDRRGIAFDGRSKALTLEMIKKADLVLCMTAAHQSAATGLAGEDETLAERIHLLDPSGGDVADPIGQGQAVYDRVAIQLADLIPARVESLLTPA
jgi:protein-tyrosine-phosphatase